MSHGIFWFHKYLHFFNPWLPLCRLHSQSLFYSVSQNHAGSAALVPFKSPMATLFSCQSKSSSSRQNLKKWVLLDLAAHHSYKSSCQSRQSKLSFQRSSSLHQSTNKQCHLTSVMLGRPSHKTQHNSETVTLSIWSAGADSVCYTLWEGRPNI